MQIVKDTLFIVFLVALIPFGIVSGKAVVSNIEFNVTFDRAILGDSDMQFRLAAYYHYGHFIEMDIDEARKWYKLAALNGNEDAKEILCSEFKECD